MSQSSVYDANSTLKAQTTYTYDNYSLNSSGITTQHDANPPTGTYRGNQTQVKAWLNGSTVSTTNCPVSISNGNLTSTKTYYDTGMLYQASDPCPHTTTYSYSSTYAGAYVTQTQSPTTNSPNQAQHIISGTYDPNTGLIASFTDENSKTSNFQYDTMWRFTTATFPDTGETDFHYPDVTTVERTQKIDATRTTDLYVRFDGFGREIRRITANDESTPWDQVDTCYDAVGNVGFLSYPYQGTGLSMPEVCPTPEAGDTFSYDALHRKTLTTHSDSTSVMTSYTGVATSVQDEGNGTRRIQKVSQADGLGRLISVCEVSGITLQVGASPAPVSCGQDISATGFFTTYSYDTLSNLTGVTQSGLNARSFVYNSLSQITSSTNPESGTTTYSYDANMNPVSRVAPAPNQSGSSTVTTTYAYDPLNRLLSKTYSDNSTPNVTLNYDEASAMSVTLTNTTGRQSSVFVKNSSNQTLAEEVFSYDQMGRATNNSQCTTQNCGTGSFSLTYGYDLIGDMTTSTNGKGTTLTDQYNRALRLTQVTSSLSDSNHPGTLVSGVHYNAFGVFSSGTLGNGLPQTQAVTTRGFLQSISVGTSGNVYSLAITSYAPDGDILQANDNVNGNWVYTYDDFNRLLTSNKNTGQQAFAYVYDRFGNRWQQNVTAGSGPNPSFSFDAKNRITGAPQNCTSANAYCYDSAGNLLNDGTHTYTYDSENRITAVDSGGTASYVYDAEGRRIRKTVSSVSVDYLYDLAGNVVTEVSSTGGWNRGEVFAGAHHLATYSGGTSGTTYFMHGDHLGSERARTGVNGVVTETCTNLPFGDGHACVGTDVSPMHFTGKQRDPETQNDDFGARYYGSGMGRWMTPDWSARREAMPYADAGNPQTLNLYTYVLNNPTTRIDADGHAVDISHEQGPNGGVCGDDPCIAGPALDTESGPTCRGGHCGGRPGEADGGIEDDPAQNQTLSQKGLEFIERHEGYSDKVYKDSAGNPTIGYGHLIKEGEDFSKGITKEKAGELLAQDTKTAVDAVNGKVTAKLSQTKFDAVVDFTYNLGVTNLGKSTLLKNINAGKDVTKENFTDWNHAGGKVVNGLTIRRTDEFNLFSKGDYGGP